MAILLKDATFIDWKSLTFSTENILIDQNSDAIQFIRDIDKLVKTPDLEVIDCKGKLVTKSFAVGHHHVYSALSR